MTAVLDQLDVFYGETSDSLARVYARVTDLGDFRGLSLTGFVRGPFCHDSRTLPTTIRLKELGAGVSLLAEAIVPDPCFWSPDVPSLYEVTVELRRDSQTLELATRQVGIRALGPRGRSLFFHNRRWVPRGVSLGDPSLEELLRCREAAAVAVTEPTDDVLCAEASRRGVMICARLREITGDVLSRVRRLARHAAIGMLFIDGDCNVPNPRVAAPNIAFGKLIASGQPVSPPSWASFVVGHVQTPEKFAAQFADSKLPVVAMRQLEQNRDIEDARAACDVLQRELAQAGDYAGYIV